jgi:hypothetical protein
MVPFLTEVRLNPAPNTKRPIAHVGLNEPDNEVPSFKGPYQEGDHEPTERSITPTIKGPYQEGNDTTQASYQPSRVPIKKVIMSPTERSITPTIKGKPFSAGTPIHRLHSLPIIWAAHPSMDEVT